MRVKGGGSRTKYKKLFHRAKGFWGKKKNVLHHAEEQVVHAMASAYKDRRKRKRNFASLWNVRINAAAHMNGMNYSTLICGLHKAGITLNRRMLADIAVRDAEAFTALASLAKPAA